MTPKMGAEQRGYINLQRFKIGCQYAKNSGVSTVLFTGKGEPTLFPDEIFTYLYDLGKYNFPFIELQTNGLTLLDDSMLKNLEAWRSYGLSTIVISVAHYGDDKNQEIYTPNTMYSSLATKINMLHKKGFSVRLSCVLMVGYIDLIEEIENMISFCRRLGVEQLTFRQLGIPHNSGNPEVEEFVCVHKLSDNKIRDIRLWFDNCGTRLMELMHGAVVYDYKGQNVCLTDCLTIDPTQEKLRQLIFSNDNHLRYDWQYEGAILL
jgi:molybdenum cofactor biosynthesis enzyme MoaA